MAFFGTDGCATADVGVHPQSELLLKRPKPLPHPHPSLLPQIENRMISQIIEQHPLLLKVVLLLHPQFVADKSLMIEPPSFICFMVYLMYRAGPCFR